MRFASYSEAKKITPKKMTKISLQSVISRKIWIRFNFFLFPHKGQFLSDQLWKNNLFSKIFSAISCIMKKIILIFFIFFQMAITFFLNVVEKNWWHHVAQRAEFYRCTKFQIENRNFVHFLKFQRTFTIY